MHLTVDVGPSLVAKTRMTRPVGKTAFSMGESSFGDADGDDEPDERSGKFHGESRGLVKGMTGPKLKVEVGVEAKEVVKCGSGC